MFPGLGRRGLSTNDHATGGLGKQSQDTLAGTDLVLAVEDVQEHYDVDDVPSASGFGEWSVCGFVEEIGADEAATESGFVAEKRVADTLVVREDVGPVYVVERNAIVDQFAEILAHTCTEIQEGSGGLG